jgi:hypothetical protein
MGETEVELELELEGVNDGKWWVSRVGMGESGGKTKQSHRGGYRLLDSAVVYLGTSSYRTYTQRYDPI